MLIDCNSCQAKPSACDDCVMSVLLDADPMGTELDDTETMALGALAAEGMVPPLRLVPRRALPDGDRRGWRTG